jgi:Glycosyl hydrolase catalytic core
MPNPRIVRRGVTLSRSLVLAVLLVLTSSACDIRDPLPAEPPAGGASSPDASEPDDNAEEPPGDTEPTEPGDDSAAEPYKGVANSPCTELEQLGATWFYNWSTDGESCGGAEFVPMVWGGSGLTPDDVSAAVERVADAGHTAVLGFNEPDRPDQANMTVDQAVALWPSLTSNDDILVGSPATSSAPEGQQWMEAFMAQATDQDLRIDFLAVHWYGWGGGSCDPEAAGLDQYLDWAETLPGDLPIWITEFGCLNESNPDAATVQAFYEGAVEMLEEHPRVVRYAWFPWTANNHLAEDGALTPLGDAFAAAPAHR